MAIIQPTRFHCPNTVRTIKTSRRNSPIIYTSDYVFIVDHLGDGGITFTKDHPQRAPSGLQMPLLVRAQVGRIPA